MRGWSGEVSQNGHLSAGQWQHGPADRPENVFSRPQIPVVPFWNICGPCRHKATPLPKCELGQKGTAVRKVEHTLRNCRVFEATSSVSYQLMAQSISGKTAIVTGAGSGIAANFPTFWSRTS
jgi:hypothetical protein